MPHNPIVQNVLHLKREFGPSLISSEVVDLRDGAPFIALDPRNTRRPEDAFRVRVSGDESADFRLEVAIVDSAGVVSELEGVPNKQRENESFCNGEQPALVIRNEYEGTSFSLIGSTVVPAMVTVQREALEDFGIGRGYSHTDRGIIYGFIHGILRRDVATRGSESSTAPPSGLLAKLVRIANIEANIGATDYLLSMGSPFYGALYRGLVSSLSMPRHNCVPGLITPDMVASRDGEPYGRVSAPARRIYADGWNHGLLAGHFLGIPPQMLYQTVKEVRIPRPRS